MDKKTIKFLFITFLGLTFTQCGVDSEYHRRGYYAVGGEIFILPCVYLVAYGLPYVMKRLRNDKFDNQEENENGTEQEKISANKKNGSQGDVELHHQAKIRGTKRSA